MKFLLDTDTCVYLLNGNPSLKKKVEEVGVFSLAISNSFERIDDLQIENWLIDNSSKT